MNEKVRAYLIELARKNKTVTYQQLSDACNLNLIMKESEFARAEIGRILGEVSSYEHQHKRPLLSCLVISKGDDYQGDGFYKLCEKLGFGNWHSLKNNVEFEINCMNECYTFWQNDSNYFINR